MLGLVRPALAVTAALLLFPPIARAQARVENYWQVDDVRIGMKGQGKTVLKGVKIESFHAEVLGVLRNTSPGRDLILCRLSGANLEKTGVIAGMSGSPIYVQGKLLGAVAFAWAYGKEPIAGVTPFVQMREFIAAQDRREIANKQHPRRVSLRAPVEVEGRSYDTVTVAEDFGPARPAAADGLWLVPLRTPLMASGMSARSLALLKGTLGRFGLVPMQGGAAALANIPEEERNVPIQPGGALSVAMITGDFDLSGIGTVTHVEGKRVYGWGHPFMSLGGCDLPLMTGYTHTIYPRLSLSFKMGSPLRTVGAINADVSTCIAGWLDRQPDMLPVAMTVLREPAGQARTFHVKVIRQRQLMGSLVQMAMLNCLDMEGDLPEEVTAQVKLKVDLEGREPLVLHDTCSGPMFAGARGQQAMFAPVSFLLNQVTANNFQNVRVKSVEGTIEILPGRRTAEIESSELESDIVAPGATLRANVVLRQYKGGRERVTLSLPLPADLPEGSYTAAIGDGLNNARTTLRDNPHLNYPQTLEHLLQALKLTTEAKRTNLVLRVAVNGAGVAVAGKTLPDLPPGMVQLLGQGRRTGAQTLRGALVVQQATGWVIQGTDTLRFQVERNRGGAGD